MLKTLKFRISLILPGNLGSRAQKSPKIAQKTGHLIAITHCFLKRYGIDWVVPGESSCPEDSEYVWQKGVESLEGRVTAAQS